MVLLTIVLGEEIYENSTNICERCKCLRGRQFVLDCSDSGIHNTIAEWPEHDTSLVATFSNNNIGNLEVLPHSDKVTDLIFSHCNIKSLDNGVFKAVRNIQLIDLSYNDLVTEGISPEKFKGPYNNTVYEPLGLTQLNLAYNRIHSLPHKIFEHLADLRQLNLEGNQFKVLDPPTQMALSTLSNLETLNLASNQLTELVGDAVKSLRNLKELNLSYNNLDAVPETLSYLGETLEYLYLDHNPIFEMSDESFLGVKSVIELSLTNLPRLTYVNVNTFSPIKNLKVLFLHTNKNLFDINSQAFGENQTLEELYVQDNALNDLNYNLTKWSNLKLVNMSGNDFFCGCNMYNIAKDLKEDVKRDKDGPVCVNLVSGQSMMIYELTEEACEYQTTGPSPPYHLIIHHYRILRIFTVLVAVALIVCLLLTITILLLRYRKYRMNRSYPFATQIWYNPITNTVT